MPLEAQIEICKDVAFEDTEDSRTFERSSNFWWSNLGKWIRELQSSVGGSCNPSKARIPNRNWWFGGCCIRWAIGTDFIAKTCRASPT